MKCMGGGNFNKTTLLLLLATARYFKQRKTLNDKNLSGLT
jgi:hypothetical protein